MFGADEVSMLGLVHRMAEDKPSTEAVENKPEKNRFSATLENLFARTPRTSEQSLNERATTTPANPDQGKTNAFYIKYILLNKPFN